MKSILLLSCLCLISCGTTQGVRVTAESITIGKVNGIGEDTATENSTITASNGIGSVTITNNSTGKNQSNTVQKIASGVVTLGIIKGATKVAEQGISTTADVITDLSN